LELMTRYADQTVLINKTVIKRASELDKMGFGVYDALHVACAENCGADIFLTTDDKLLRLADACAQNLEVRIDNPLIWLREMI